MAKFSVFIVYRSYLIISHNKHLSINQNHRKQNACFAIEIHVTISNTDA